MEPRRPVLDTRIIVVRTGNLLISSSLPNLEIFPFLVWTITIATALSEICRENVRARHKTSYNKVNTINILNESSCT